MNEILRLKKLEERKTSKQEYGSKGVNGRHLFNLNDKKIINRIINEPVGQLEQHCQRMIYEKEEKIIENENALKQEDHEVNDLESEIKALEQQMKEKQ